MGSFHIVAAGNLGMQMSFLNQVFGPLKVDAKKGIPELLGLEQILKVLIPEKEWKCVMVGVDQTYFEVVLSRS